MLWTLLSGLEPCGLGLRPAFGWARLLVPPEVAVEALVVVGVCGPGSTGSLGVGWVCWVRTGRALVLAEAELAIRTGVPAGFWRILLAPEVGEAGADLLPASPFMGLVLAILGGASGVGGLARGGASGVGGLARGGARGVALPVFGGVTPWVLAPGGACV